jgi:hypothetical protein
MKLGWITTLAWMAIATGCAVEATPSSGSADSESTRATQSALLPDGRVNSCTPTQISGGYEDVDGDCLLTCWNCPGSVGGGSGSVPGGCHTPICGGGGDGSGGGGRGGSGGSPLPGDPPGRGGGGGGHGDYSLLCKHACERELNVCDSVCDQRYDGRRGAAGQGWLYCRASCAGAESECLQNCTE